MKTNFFLHKALITMACAGGLILAVGCSSYRHHGPESCGKGDRIERPRPEADHAPIRMRERAGRPEMGKARMEARREGQGMAMRGQGPGAAMRGGQGGPGMAMRGGREPGLAAQMLLTPRAKQELGLSDDQVKQIRAITERNKEQRRAIAERQRAGQQKMRELMEAERPDKQAIMSQIEKTGNTMTEMRKLQAGEMLDVRGVLTPEQIKKARELRRGPEAPESMDGRGMGRGRGPMDRPQGGIGRPQDGEGRPGPAPQTF
ncbi:Spy/CpxP family protein refolding chaperone [bacterium]|nr:Spy/CpxP family protein refolding chaperone [bacterium]